MWGQPPSAVQSSKARQGWYSQLMRVPILARSVRKGGNSGCARPGLLPIHLVAAVGSRRADMLQTMH
jgi:hypothetical protein